jgi:hypothetical protein
MLHQRAPPSMHALTTASSLSHRYAPVKCSTNERAQSARGSVPETARRTHLQRMLLGLRQSPPQPSVVVSTCMPKPSPPSKPSASAAMATPSPQHLHCRHRRHLASRLHLGSACTRPLRRHLASRPHLGFRFTRWRRRGRYPPKHGRRVVVSTGMPKHGRRVVVSTCMPKHGRRVGRRPRSQRRCESRCCRRRYASRRREMACADARIIPPGAVRGTPREEGPPLWGFSRERHCCSLRGTI